MTTNTVSETFKATPVMLVELTGFYYTGNLDDVPPSFNKELLKTLPVAVDGDMKTCALLVEKERKLQKGDIVLMGVTGTVFAVTPECFEKCYKIV